MYSPCRIHPRRFDFFGGTLRTVTSAPKAECTVAVGAATLQNRLPDLQRRRVVQVELVLEMAEERDVVVAVDPKSSGCSSSTSMRLVDAARQLGDTRAAA